MEATVAAPIPPSQNTALSTQTSPKKNKAIRTNITVDHEAFNRALGATKKSEATQNILQKTTNQQSPTNTIVPAQELGRKAQSIAPPSPQHTLPAVQDFLQKAYETVQRSQQNAIAAAQESQQKAVSSHPTPKIATALIQRSMQNMVISSQLIPKTTTATPPPFQNASSSVITAQQLLFKSLTAVQESVPKAEAAALPIHDKSTSGQIKPTMVKDIEKALNASQRGQSMNTVCRPGYFSNKTCLDKPIPRQEPASPQKRAVLVAKRRRSPSMKTETSEVGNSEVHKDKSSSESEKSQSTSSSQTSRSESSSDTPSTSEPTPKDSPIKQGTSRVAQTFLTYKAAQKERLAKGLQTQSPKKHVSQSSQSEAGGSARSNGGRRPKEPEPETDPKRRVLVTEFPPYTQIPDLMRVLIPFGPCKIDKCRNRLAVVTFETEEGAQKAIKATNELSIYGDFLEIKPYTTARDVDELFRAYKKVIATQKGQDIIQPDKIDLSGDFYQQVDNIQNAIRLTREQVQAVANLYMDLEMVLQQEWPGCVAVPFGSIPAGLGIKSSDADCFVRLPGGAGAGAGGAAFVQRARRLLALYPRVFSQLVAIPRANTPILKFRHLPSGFHCDVSAKTPLGAQNSELIKLLLERDPRLPPVAVLVKYWAKVHELSGTGRLTNYALTMMVVFYLQRRALLPPVVRLQEPATQVLVDHWDAGFARRLPPAACSVALPDLLGGFFEFYATFDFERQVVCPYLGAPVRKALFDAPESLPPEFARYAANVRANLAGALRHATPFCVQDPFEQSHNVSSGVSARLAADIRAHVRLAADAYAAERASGARGFLRAALCERPRPQRARAPPSTRVCLLPRLRARLAPADWRACVRELVVEQVFERMLGVRLARQLERERAEGEARALRLGGRARREPRPRAPAALADKELYSGAACKPVWRRRRDYAALEPPARLVRRQRAHTDDIAAAAPDSPLRFDLELWFAEEPRSCFVFARLADGELDAFRGLVAFMHTAMFDWFKILVRPHLAPDGPPAPTAANAVDPVPKTVTGARPVPKSETGVEPITKPAAASEPVQKSVAASDPVPKPAGASEPVPKSVAASEPVPKPVGASEPVPKPAAASEPVPKPAAAPDPVPKPAATAELVPKPTTTAELARELGAVSLADNAESTGNSKKVTSEAPDT